VTTPVDLARWVMPMTAQRQSSLLRRRSPIASDPSLHLLVEIEIRIEIGVAAVVAARRRSDRGLSSPLAARKHAPWCVVVLDFLLDAQERVHDDSLTIDTMMGELFP